MAILHHPLTPDDLPPPPPQKWGWGWTQGSDPVSPQGEYPLISIVIPSYNQGQFLEETLRSVLLQNYPRLEVIVIDGGSTDGTVEVLQKYAPFLTYWVSEPDNGQSDAINKGFQRATGALIGWQNSDDTYEPNTFKAVAEAFLSHPEADVFYGLVRHIDEAGNFVADYPVTEATVANMIPYSAVTNHSFFYTQKVFKAGHFINTNLKHCMDQEFILRLLLNQFNFYFEPRIIGNWRIYKSTKSSRQMDVWAQESFNLCWQVYHDQDLDKTTKSKARDCLYSLCLNNFNHGRASIFCDQMQVLFKEFGFFSLSGIMWIKYALALLGEKQLQKLLYVKEKYSTKLS
ncbi:glycosyltransferase family 2 protein [Spirulina sp. CS-785/01]|uniref:glycosyltransferase family 2 protein n=1 Tax=Spirulina sp. CS-785/01 TaxID=3021716 RepID=UPI00232F8980|nr:glycosyltransferase family 2 protein [Spirulina sp. CS-785/01]MDB9311789.1 glycosyltransferase family 2 protein [Spirulina sp. CS-785/01]